MPLNEWTWTSSPGFVSTGRLEILCHTSFAYSCYSFVSTGLLYLSHAVFFSLRITRQTLFPLISWVAVSFRGLEFQVSRHATVSDIHVTTLWSMVQAIHSCAYVGLVCFRLSFRHRLTMLLEVFINRYIFASFSCYVTHKPRSTCSTSDKY